MPFPISPVNDQTYITPQGTAYRYYAANKAWNIIGAGTDVTGLTPNYLPLAVNSTTLGDSPIFLNGSQLDANSNVENGYVFGMENTRDDWDANGLRVGVKNLQTGTVIQEWRSDNTRRAAVDCINGMFVDSSLGSYSLYDNTYSHGVTDILPTNVHGRISSAIDLSDGESLYYGKNCGGLKLVGIDAYGTYAAVDVKAVSEVSWFPCINISASRKLGTSDTTIFSDSVLVSFKNKDDDKVHIMGNGDLTTAGSFSAQNITASNQVNAVALNIGPNNFRVNGTTITFASVVKSVFFDPGTFTLRGVSNPTPVNFDASTNILTTWAFDRSNIGYFNFMCPRECGNGSGTAFSAVIHWTPGSKGTDNSGRNVKWTFKSYWAKESFSDLVFTQGITKSITSTCDGTNWKHLTSTADYLINGSYAPGLIMMCSIQRDGTGDTWIDGTSYTQPQLLGVEIKYPSTILGAP